MTTWILDDVKEAELIITRRKNQPREGCMTHDGKLVPVKLKPELLLLSELRLRVNFLLF